MSTHALSIDEKHFRAAAEKARALGMSPGHYVQTLIDADSRSFDEILEPAREGFAKMKDEEVEDLLDRAQKSARK